MIRLREIWERVSQQCALASLALICPPLTLTRAILLVLSQCFPSHLPPSYHPPPVTRHPSPVPTTTPPVHNHTTTAQHYAVTRRRVAHQHQPQPQPQHQHQRRRQRRKPQR